MARPRPSLDKTRWQHLREVIDAAFVDKVRELEDAYYGTALQWDETGQVKRIDRDDDGWIHGASHPVTLGGRTFDSTLTNLEPKELFDRLHGALWTLHELALFSLNEVRGRPHGDIHISEREENRTLKPNKKVEYDLVTVDRREDTRQKLAAFAADHGVNLGALADELVAVEARQAVKSSLNA